MAAAACRSWRGPLHLARGAPGEPRDRWKGSAPHNVTVTSGPAKFRSATRTKGRFSKKLTKTGTYKLVCTIHDPGMSMTIKVR